jgi:hypothetical protein
MNQVSLSLPVMPSNRPYATVNGGQERALVAEVQQLRERYPHMSLDRAALIARRKLRLPPPAEITVTLRDINT